MTVDAPASVVASTERGEPTLVRDRGRIRRLVGWLVVALLVAVVAAAGLLFANAGSRAQRYVLDPESAGPDGTRALVELLRHEGVAVEVARTRADVERLLDERSSLVTSDPTTLTDAGTQRLLDRSDDVVLLSASARILRLTRLGGYADEPSPSRAGPGCEVAAFSRVGTIAPGQLFRAAPGVTACFGDAEGAAVLLDERDGQRRAIVDGSTLFTNEHLAENGNAALGLALLGTRPRVVWYVPSIEDTDRTDTDADASLGDLVPGWVTPASILLVIAAATAGVWRGRRFGPLVAETLPVTVRASETMLGRARLTAKAADAAHAAQALRDGTTARLARRLGLASRADPASVADAVADRIRADRAACRAVLTGPLPTSDAELVPFARNLTALETAVEDAVRIERSTRD